MSVRPTVLAPSRAARGVHADVGADAIARVDVGAVLRRCRDAVDPALHAAVDRLDPVSAAQASYHLGWTGTDGAPTRSADGGGGGGGGKAVRPALALLGARLATGGDPSAEERAVPAAAAVELVHNFSLVHDDLMDGDTERRHRPTVWARWGTASAVLTGDAMLAVAQEIVLEAASPHAAAAGRILARAVREVVAGQVDDVAFEQRDDVTVEQCLAMAEGKTGALLAASAEIGAVLAGGSSATAAALRTFGAELGLAFQLVDDLLGIWGDPALTGKAVLADLRARKKTLPVTFAVHHGDAAGRELAAWLATPPEDDTEPALRRAAALVESGGGRQWAGAEARRRLARAESALADLADLSADDRAGDTSAPGARARAELVALGRFLADRES